VLCHQNVTKICLYFLEGFIFPRAVYPHIISRFATTGHEDVNLTKISEVAAVFYSVRVNSAFNYDVCTSGCTGCQSTHDMFKTYEILPILQIQYSQ